MVSVFFIWFPREYIIRLCCASGLQKGRVSGCQLQHAASGGGHWWEREAVPSPKAMGHANRGETFQTTGQAKVSDTLEGRRKQSKHQRSCQDKRFSLEQLGTLWKLFKPGSHQKERDVPCKNSEQYLFSCLSVLICSCSEAMVLRELTAPWSLLPSLSQYVGNLLHVLTLLGPPH